MNDKMLFVCLHNRFVDCGNFNCSRCGWNPSNKALRNRRVIKVLENCKKPKKGKVKALAPMTQKKPVYCPELDRTFSSRAEASRELGVDPKEIYLIITGKRKTTKGLTFVEAEV